MNTTEITGVTLVNDRIVNVGTAEQSLLLFDTAAAAGQFADSTVDYLRITNLDGTNFVSLRVTAGNDEYFECTIKDWHVAVGGDGQLFYTHRCEYEGGTFDHDLSKATFEVIEVAQAKTARPTGGMAARGSLRPLRRLRRPSHRHTYRRRLPSPSQRLSARLPPPEGSPETHTC